MGELMKTSILTLCFCQLFLPLTWAYDFCYSRTCYDKGNEIGYCCQYYENTCCYYTAVWGLWYFWFGIILFVLSIILLVVRICFIRSLRRRQRNLHVTTVTTQQAGIPNQGYGGINTSNDYPPSYQQVQKDYFTGNKSNPSQTGNVYAQPPCTQTPYSVPPGFTTLPAAPYPPPTQNQS
ncbi:unnamed protein product [Clavelina lepadiformis]|uniref:Vesicular, overexpressed in cancer, prosurvival protein 1 n=1 Tax=Clavelina lepadiformis TaxID=159417 RepID=A0ABP0EYH4_CLALP